MEDTSNQALGTPEHAARVILENAKRARSHMHYGERVEAAKVLLSDFWPLAQQQGFSVLPSNGGSYTVGTGGGNVVVDLSERGEISVGTDVPYDKATNVSVAALAFDPIANIFVGTELDPDVTPVPGAPRPRMHPFVVLANLVAQKLPGKIVTR